MLAQHGTIPQGHQPPLESILITAYLFQSGGAEQLLLTGINAYSGYGLVFPAQVPWPSPISISKNIKERVYPYDTPCSSTSNQRRLLIVK